MKKLRRMGLVCLTVLAMILPVCPASAATIEDQSKVIFYQNGAAVAKDAIAAGEVTAKVRVASETLDQNQGFKIILAAYNSNKTELKDVSYQSASLWAAGAASVKAPAERSFAVGPVTVPEGGSAEVYIWNNDLTPEGEGVGIVNRGTYCLSGIKLGGYTTAVDQIGRRILVNTTEDVTGAQISNVKAPDGYTCAWSGNAIVLTAPDGTAVTYPVLKTDAFSAYDFEDGMQGWKSNGGTAEDGCTVEQAVDKLDSSNHVIKLTDNSATKAAVARLNVKKSYPYVVSYKVLYDMPNEGDNILFSGMRLWKSTEPWESMAGASVGYANASDASDGYVFVGEGRNGGNPIYTRAFFDLNTWHEASIAYVDENTAEYYFDGKLVAVGKPGDNVGDLASLRFMTSPNNATRTCTVYLDDVIIRDYYLQKAELSSASFTATATVYGKTYPGKVNRKLHTITFDVPKTVAEDLNASVSREENGYLPIGNHHFDTSYTIALFGASAACDGEAISSGTAFPVGGDRTLAITDQNGNTENYTVEVHISETAAVTEHSDGFSVSGIAARGLADKLTVTHSFTVQSADAESDLFRMGSEDLPLSVIVTTKGQNEGYFTLRIGGTHRSTCAVSGQVPAFSIGKPYTLTYLFRKTTDGGICEMYVENTLLAVAPCSEKELANLGSGQDISFCAARIGGESGSITLSDISAAMVRPRPALYVEKLPDGKNTAYTFTADDGFVGSAKWYCNTFKNLGLRGSLALNSSTADVSGLTPYVSDGVFDIGNHGKTHKVLTNLEDTVLDDEVTNGQAELREKFPGSSVLTMYLPNNQQDDTVMQKLHESHYAVRYSGGNRSNSLYLGKEGLYTTTFYAVNSGENKTDLARLKWRFDDARSKGRWIVEMWHEVKGDDVDGTPKLTDPYVYDSAEAKQYFTYVASHLDEVYSGGYETMVQYLLERDYLRMQQLTAEADKMTYRAAYDSSMLLRPEDAAYFKTPLTVNTVVPDEWRKVLVTQGENVAVYPVYREQSAQLGAKERNYVLFDIVPDGGEITLQSVPEDYEILGDAAEISAASVKVGIYHYEAVINPESHTMTFAVPYTALKSETEAADGKISPGVTPDLSKLEMTLTGEGRITADGVRVDKTFTFDADNLKEITVEAKEKRVTYQVNFVPMVLAGRYNCNGATLTSTTEMQASRRGVPKLLNDGNVYFGNSGDGIWRINQSAMAYLDDGSVDEANTYAHLQIASRTDDSENQYIRFVKDRNTTGSAKVQLYRQNSYGNSGAKALRSKVSFNLHSFTKNNDGMIYLWSSDLDQIVLSSKGMNNNRFTLCHRGTTNDFMQPFETSPVLETNTWYTLICDFVRTEAEEHGYYMDVYLQKEGETMQRLGRISNQATCPSGKINWQDNKNEFMLAAWSNAIFDLGIDDYEIMTLIDDTQYDTTVYLLGDSICRYYDPSKLAPQQGWGEYVFSMFRDNVRVRNYSVGGYNTNIYLHGANRPEPNKMVSPPILPSILRELREGDYVMVALGWNEANRYDGTKNTAAFKQNLAQIADRCKEKGASVIFVTATPNLTQDYTALANSCLTGLYSGTECVCPVTDMKDFAAQNGYLCLDLNTAMYARLSAMQPSEYKEVFTGSSSADPNNSINKDYLHLTQTGADLAGQLIRELLADSSSPLCAYLK